MSKQTPIVVKCGRDERCVFEEEATSPAKAHELFRDHDCPQLPPWDQPLGHPGIPLRPRGPSDGVTSPLI